MKNYVTQKMRGIRRMVWFWSWLVVMLAMTEVSWGQVYPLYGHSDGDKKHVIGEVEVSFDTVEDDNPENDYVNFNIRYKPGFQETKGVNLLWLNGEHVSDFTRIYEYETLISNNANPIFTADFEFSPIDNA